MKDVIESCLVIEGIEASTKEDVFDEILASAVAEKRLTKARAAKVRQRLVEREALGSTGIGNGVAVPHTKVEGVKSTLMVLARSREGLEFDAVDGRPVHVVFLLVAPPDAADEHLKLLRWISRLARSVDFRRFMQSARGEAEIRSLLSNMVREL
jgi:PTS system nitrogen regulatory IIA component